MMKLYSQLSSSDDENESDETKETACAASFSFEADAFSDVFFDVLDEASDLFSSSVSSVFLDKKDEAEKTDETEDENKSDASSKTSKKTSEKASGFDLPDVLFGRGCSAESACAASFSFEADAFSDVFFEQQ
jgi:hypothetical protein